MYRLKMFLKGGSDFEFCVKSYEIEKNKVTGEILRFSWEYFGEKTNPLFIRLEDVSAILETKESASCSRSG